MILDRSQVLFYNTLMIDKKVVKKLYYENKFGYAKIGKIFGVTRQRIHQIVKDYRKLSKNKIQKKLVSNCVICNQKATILHHIDGDTHNNNILNLLSVCYLCHIKIHETQRRVKAELRCKGCNRLFGIEVGYGVLKESLCEYCSSIKYNNVKNPFSALFYVYGDICRGCNKKTKEGKRRRGYHINCWYRTEEYRAKNRKRLRNYYKKRYSTDPEFRKRILNYNKKYRLKKKLANNLQIGYK